MSRRVLPSIALALVPVVLSAAAPTSSRDEESAIRALIERVEAANNAGDVVGWVGLFADKFVYMAPNSPPVTTRGELTELATAGFRNKTAIDIAPVEIQICGNWAFAVTRVTGSVKLHTSGDVVTVDVKELAVYARDELGSWRIARLINNSNS